MMENVSTSKEGRGAPVLTQHQRVRCLARTHGGARLMFVAICIQAFLCLVFLLYATNQIAQGFGNDRMWYREPYYLMAMTFGIMAFIGVWLTATIKLGLGARQFGRRHAVGVALNVLFVVLWFVFFVMGGVMSSMLIDLAHGATTMDYLYEYRDMAVAAASFFAIASIFLAASFYLSIRAIAGASGIRFLRGAMVVSVIGLALASLLVSRTFSSAASSATEIAPNDFQGSPYLMMGLQFASLMMLLVPYRMALASIPGTAGRVVEKDGNGRPLTP